MATQNKSNQGAKASQNKPGQQVKSPNGGFLRATSSGSYYQRNPVLKGQGNYSTTFVKSDPVSHDQLEGIIARINADHARRENLLRQELKERKKEKKQKKKLKKAETPWYDTVLKTVGKAIPHILPMIMGMGDYTVTQEMPATNSIAAAATNGKIGGSPPYMHRVGESVRITKREYLGDVYSSTSAFSLLTFPINPGMNETFPWLSLIAQQFQEYRLLGCCFEFISEGSEYANVAGLGYVALATQYNSNTGVFLDKKQMLNYEFSVSGKPSQNLIHCVECKPNDLNMKTKFIRTGTLATTQNVNFYDWGIFSLAVGGNTANNSIIGELWVTYDLELIIPRSVENINPSIQYSFTQSTAFDSADPLGTTAQTFSNNNTFNLGMTATTLYFPNGVRGWFNIFVQWVGTTVGAPIYPSVTPTNCSLSSNPLLSGTCPETTASTVLVMSMNMSVVVAQDGAILTFGTAGVFPTGTRTVCAVASQRPVPNPNPLAWFDRLGKEKNSHYSSFMKKLKDDLSPVEEKKKKSKSVNTFWDGYVETENFIVEVSDDDLYRFCSKDDPMKYYPLSGEEFDHLDEITLNFKEVDDFLSKIRDNFLKEKNQLMLGPSPNVNNSNKQLSPTPIKSFNQTLKEGRSFGNIR